MRHFYDIAGQRRRRRRILGDFAEKWLGIFDARGRWQGEPAADPPRSFERMTWALNFLASEQPAAISEANAIIGGTELSFCHFMPLQCIYALTEHRDKLAAAQVRRLEAYVIDSLDAVSQPDLDFVGVNDNFPCHATYIAIVGGKLFERPDVSELGRRRLAQFVAQFERCGVATEYASPTYTFGQIHPLALLANHIEDPEIRDMALFCEARLWVNLFGQFFAPAARMAGPYSRAYTRDVAGPGLTGPPLYLLLGARLSILPGADLPEDSRERAAAFAYNDFVLTDLHCPEELVEWGLDRAYPFSFQATTEFASSTDDPPTGAGWEDWQREELQEYPAGRTIVSTYMTDSYALGVASREYHSGCQTESFHLTYLKKSLARKQVDTGVAYARYVTNGFCGDGMLWRDMGRKIGLHHEHSAMMLYKPRLFARKTVSKLQLSLVFPKTIGIAGQSCGLSPRQPGRAVDEIWLGKERVAGFPCESREACPVFVRDGDVYMAFLPLLLTDHGRRAAVRVEQDDQYITASFINYEGPERDFDPDELAATGNGFVCEVRSADDVEWEAFRNCFDNASVGDELFTCCHLRGTQVRRTSYSNGHVSFACEFSVRIEGVRFATVNGKTPVIDQIKTSGINPGTFLSYGKR